ncbi:MAG TPA: histidinol-phosphate transaminase [Polyangia bacterium]|jgi:histidinol-phosphate aminotransferase
MSDDGNEAWKELVRQPLRGAPAYVVAAHPNAIKLDANESPYPLSRAAMEAMARELASVELNRYPDATAGDLRRALAARAGCAVEELMLGNGSDELIALLCATFAEPRAGQSRGKIAYAVPGFVVFRTAALAHGLEPIEVPFGPRMEADEAALFAAIAEHKPNLVFLATPNNPTGTQWSRATVVKLVEQHRDIITVVDEAYLSYCDARSCVDLALANPNCVVLQTLSKIGLAALRVGLLIGRREVLAAVEKVRPPYNLSTLAQRAALKLVVDFKAELASHFEEAKRQRRALYDALGQLAGLEVFPSGGNFLLVRAKEARALYDALVERGVLVRLFDSGLLTGCMRITVGTPEENSWLLDAIKAALV